jgi:molybdenum cofactor cytidylyltransferase
VIAAIVLAAGLSRRMGRPKMSLPWGDTTVIGQIMGTLSASRLDEIFVVVGGASADVEEAIQNVQVSTPVKTLLNPHFAEVEMTYSVQVGLRALGEKFKAAMIVLGDQPQMKVEVVNLILSAYADTESPLVVPSYKKRRGHPWLVARALWPMVIGLKPSQTLRDFLGSQAGQIHYVDVNTPSVLQDIDTPAEYDQYRPTEEV